MTAPDKLILITCLMPFVAVVTMSAASAWRQRQRDRVSREVARFFRKRNADYKP